MPNDGKPKPVIKKDPKYNSLKNKDKKSDKGGWCTEDLQFDQDGALYIKNVALAEELQQAMDSWGERLTIYRDKFSGETTSGGGITGNLINMMCSCSEPP